MNQAQISPRKRVTGEEIAMNDGNNTAGKGNNRSVAEIRAAFELYYPHLPTRHSLLRLLVQTIRSVHNQANGPWRWTVTSPRSGKALINLNTSINSATSLLPIQVRSDNVIFLVEGPLASEIEDHIRAAGGEITIPRGYAHYSMANPQEITMTASQIATLYPLIETCHRCGRLSMMCPRMDCTTIYTASAAMRNCTSKSKEQPEQAQPLYLPTSKSPMLANTIHILLCT